PELRVAADRRPVDQDLRHGPAPGELEELLAERGIVVERDLLVLVSPRVEQCLGPDAVGAPASAVDPDPRHPACQRENTFKGSSTPETRLARPWPAARTRPRRSCCAPSDSAKRTGCCTSTRSSADASAPWRKASARPSLA